MQVIKTNPKDLNMKWPDLLITHGNKCIYLKNNKIHTLSPKIPWGVTWSEDVFFFTKHNSRITSYNKRFKIKDVGKYSGRNLHQIYYHPNNKKIYICNAGGNRVETLDPETCETKVVFQNKVKDKKLQINGIWNDNNGSFWVCENRLGDSKIVQYSDDFQRIKEHNIGNCIHNVVVQNGTLLTLSSMSSEILFKDLKTERIVRKRWRPEDWGLTERYFWLRGLGITKTHYIIGVTQYYKNKNKRVRKKGVILLFNKGLSKVDEGLYLPKQINDIRVMSEIDISHNGILPPFNPIP